MIDEKIAKQTKIKTGTPHTKVERPSIIAGMGLLDEYVTKSSSHSSTLYSVSTRSPWNAVHWAKISIEISVSQRPWHKVNFEQGVSPARAYLPMSMPVFSSQAKKVIKSEGFCTGFAGCCAAAAWKWYTDIRAKNCRSLELCAVVVRKNKSADLSWYANEFYELEQGPTKLLSKSMSSHRHCRVLTGFMVC